MGGSPEGPTRRGPQRYPPPSPVGSAVGWGTSSCCLGGWGATGRRLRLTLATPACRRVPWQCLPGLQDTSWDRPPGGQQADPEVAVGSDI